MFDRIDTIKYLSQFFFASNTDELEKAYLALQGKVSVPTVDDWSAVEFSFNRLFVGPRDLLAPPYASIYIERDETRVMGESTMQIRQFYGLLGLVSPWLNKIPDDHIALELDALWQIEAALRNSDSSQLYDMHKYLLMHLQAWTPKFCARIQSINDVHVAIERIAEILGLVLCTEMEKAAL